MKIPKTPTGSLLASLLTARRRIDVALRSALNGAVNRRLIDFNVAAPVKCPSQTKAQRQPWTETEVRMFLGSLTGQRLHAVMLLSLLGLRPAEVCGLRWSDVDLESGTLRVQSTRTLVATDKGIVVIEKGPKSASGRRSLPLPTQVTSALKAFKATQAREQLAAGPVYVPSGMSWWTSWVRRSAPTGYDAGPTL